jgi:hypothetical protein
MRQPEGAAGAVVEAGRADTRAGAAEGAEGGQEPLCDMCCNPLRIYARGLCRSCHRKLSDCGVPLPPPRASGRRCEPATERLARWVATLPAPVRAALRVGLATAPKDP